jgi:preprotein translocase subunit SecG
VDILIGILNVLIVLGSLFLICIILIQRGKGGGLAGAFGGVGGSSAFGTKAGDVFTKITIGVAIGWILVAMLLVKLSNGRAGSRSEWGTDTVSASKDLSSSSSKSKSKSDGLDIGPGAGEVPPPVPTPAKESGAPTSAPPVNIQAIPDQPPAQKSAPSTSTPAPATTTPAPAATTKTPAATTSAPSTATPGKAAPKP